MYIHTSEAQLNFSLNKHLHIQHGIDTKASPFDFSLPFGDNVPEVVMIKLIERLRDERQRRKRIVSDFLEKAIKGLPKTEDEYEEIVEKAISNLNKRGDEIL